MKRYGMLVLLCLSVIFQGYGQNKAIDFRKPDWNHILRQARKEKKMVFMDCYTSWCGPCKILAREVFTQDSVAEFFNRYFVCVKMDMEKEGKSLNEKYEITSYPSLLFIDPETELLVHKLTGCVKPEVLIRGGQDALSGSSSLSGLEERYRNGEREMEFMERYLAVLKAASKEKEREEVLRTYARTLTDEQFASAPMWKILEAQWDFRSDPLSEEFRRFMLLREAFYKVADPKAIDFKIMVVVRNYMARFVRWDASEGKPFDVAGCRSLTGFLQEVEFSQVPHWLAQLYTAMYMGQGDFRGMFESMQEALKYHFMDASEEAYFLLLFMKSFCRSEDKELVKEVDGWLGEWLGKHPGNILLERVKERLGSTMKD